MREKHTHFKKPQDECRIGEPMHEKMHYSFQLHFKPQCITVMVGEFLSSNLTDIKTL